MGSVLTLLERAVLPDPDGGRCVECSGRIKFGSAITLFAGREYHPACFDLVLVTAERV